MTPDDELSKYADDAAIIALIINNDESHYREEAGNFVQWCDENFLKLNVPKTK